MTEAGWLSSKNSGRMLKYLTSRVSNRKLWLFVASFWRDGSSSFSVELCRRVANITEQLAYKSVLPRDYRTVFNAIQVEMESHLAERDFLMTAYLRDFRDALFPGVITAWRSTYWGNNDALDDALLGASQRGFQAARWVTSLSPPLLCDALRDIMGNPFCLVSPAPAWLTWHDGLIASMARRMYASRNFGDLPVLADALEEAGCINADILNHCRQPGEHVRGCWVIDLLLGKE